MPERNRSRYTRQSVAVNLFFKMPKFLIYNEDFRNMSNDARILYMLLRERHELSIINEWYDEQDNVFIYFKREEMQELLNLSKNTIPKIVNELKELGLVEEERQGVNKPNRIYLLAPLETSVTTLSTRSPKNCASGVPNIETLDSQNLTPNKTNINKTEININPVMSSLAISEGKEEKEDRQDKTDNKKILNDQKLITYVERIKSNIEYEHFTNFRKDDVGLVDGFIETMLDALFTVGDTVRIGGVKKSMSVVESILLKINHEDIDHAICQYKSITTPIIKKKPYMLTLLYNSKVEGEAHYINAYAVNKREGT